MRRDFDVCIIGTGAGGGVMLDQLTRAGFEVVALQRGPNLPPQRLLDDELEVIVRDTLFARASRDLPPRRRARAPSPGASTRWRTRWAAP